MQADDEKVTVTDSGDSDYLEGDIVQLTDIRKANSNLQSSDKKPAKFERMLLGITKAALSTDSLYPLHLFKKQQGFSQRQQLQVKKTF